MKTKMTGRIISCLLAIMLCLTSFSLISAEAATVLTENTTGTEDGYSYELWKDSGNTSMTLTGEGTFSCEWSDINNCLFRKGKKFDCTQTYQELGNISIKYGVDYQPNGNSYMCVYGWTRDPLVEYYIVETWGSWRPPGATESLGQVTLNSGTYDIYKTVRENQPSIDGTATFDQYWSVRTSKPAANGTKIEGVISVSEHFKAWESVGLNMGKMYEVALNIEGYQSSGNATVYTNELSIGGDLIPDDPIDTVEPDENGYYFYDDFESGVGNWTSRGDTVTSQSSNSAASGEKSLSVTNRTDSWNGTGNSLNSLAFQAGNSYSFSTMVMQNSVSSDNFKLSLQYDIDGETKYATVAKATGSSGEWVQLANTNYTIPEGAANLLLYVETEDSTTSFFIDDAIGAVAGTNIPATGSSADISAITGDTNKSGAFEINDLVLLQQYLAGKNVTIDLEASDADENGKVNIFDLCILKNKLGKSSGSQGSDVDISWIDTSNPMVAIAFDDGPVGNSSTDSSMRILNALSDSGFHATFFYVGSWINSSAKQEEIKTAFNLGMEIGNHSYTHSYLTELSASDIRKEYDDTSALIESIIGVGTSPVMRPPYLAVNDTVKSALNDVALINCKIDTGDWNNATEDEIINKIKSAMEDGSLDNAIVLCHETYDTTASAIEYLAPYMKSQGWQIVTVSELFAANGKELKGGTLYNECN